MMTKWTRTIFRFATAMVVWVACSASAEITVLGIDSAVTAADSGPGDFTLTNPGVPLRSGIYSYTFNAGASSDMLVVTLSIERGSGNANAVSYGGQAMTLASQSDPVSGAGVWYLANPAATGAIAINMTNAQVNGIGIGIASLDGGGSAISLDAAVSVNGVASTNITTTANGCFVILAGDANATSGSPTVNSPLTAIFQGTGDIGSNQAAAGYTNGVSAGTHTYSWTPASTPRGLSIAAFVEGADTTAPLVNSYSPANGSTNVPVAQNLVATFSEAIALTGTGTITLTNLTAGTGQDISLPDAQVTVSGNALTINPTTDLALGTQYAVLISGDAIEDLAVSPNAFDGISSATTWSFTTIPPETTPPSITDLDPVDGAVSVSPSATLLATFDEPITLRAGGTITITDLTDGSSSVTITLPDARVTSPGGDNLSIDLASDLEFNTHYSVRISATAVEDQATVPNAFAGILDDTTWDFTTRPDLPLYGGSVTVYTDSSNRQWAACVFTESGTLTVTKQIDVEYLIVAGGGGGGSTDGNTSRSGGGGGAGGLLQGTGLSISGTQTITVGAGGTGGVQNGARGGKGGNSTAFGLTAIGGGGGSTAFNQDAGDGGSGGGSLFG